MSEIATGTVGVPRHKPVRAFTYLRREVGVCSVCRGPRPWPCKAAIALGVPSPKDLLTYGECLTAWWQAQGLPEDAARIAAALESVRDA
jgi:hypothetical protein